MGTIGVSEIMLRCYGMKRRIIVPVFLTGMILSSGCGSDKMKDGYYTAEMAEFSHGWKEYV